MKVENVADIYPLSPTQQGMLFHTLYAPQSGAYFIQLTWTVAGRMDVDTFRRAWDAVVTRHAVLRTAFLWQGLDQPLQVVRREATLPWEEEDWRNVPAAERDARFESFLKEDRARGFVLSQAPLMRIAMLRVADDAWRVVWSHHHLLVDGWSVSLLLGEVLASYASLIGGQDVQPAPTRPYRDYIAWLQKRDASRDESHWRETLRGFRAATPLGVDHPAGPASDETEHHEEQQVRLSTAATGALQAFARRHALTVNTLVQGAMALLLSCYSGENDVVFGVTVSGRPPELPGSDAMVGLFINTLPLRVQLHPDDRVLPWLKRIQAWQAEMLPFESTSLVNVQSGSELPPGQPLFESILVFENYPAGDSLGQSLGDVCIKDVRGLERTNFPLSVYAVPGRELTLRIGYDIRRLDARTVTRMLGHLRTLLEAIPVDPDRPLSQLDVLSESERRALLTEVNDTAAAYPKDKRIHELFEAQVERTPEAVAVVCDDRQLTYRELNRRANQLARHLRTLGVGPDSLVGIYVERSPEMMIGLLGILKAGGAYVPLDPAFPRQRLALMLDDAKVTVLLTQQALRDSLPDHRARVVCLDADWTTIAVGGEDNLAPRGTSCNLAYVIYTSGSTGLPKGVAIEHRTVVNFLCSMAREPGVSERDVLVAVTTLSFDIAALELFLPLTVGGCVVLAGRDEVTDATALGRLLDRCGGTVMQATPATWRMLLEAGWPGKKDLRILCGGEALARQLADRLLEHGSAVWNLYGPTETTIWSAVCTIVRDIQTVSIGRPIANTSIYILDARGRAVPAGVVGEICIGGDGLARGYLNRPELTAERFVPDPFAGIPGARMYRTGDLGRLLPDSTIECLGRTDHQVKLRGYRIELGDIEAALRTHPGISDAVVVARSDTAGEKRLVAYWLRSGANGVAGPELRRHVRDRLPEYMVPSFVVELKAFPLTPNGKVDRKALPAPEGDRPDAGVEYVAPRDEAERSIAEIWSALLGVDRVGIHDSFFELGGHSLLATRLTSRLREAFQVDLSVRNVFEAPTIAALVERIRSAGAVGASSIAIGGDVEEGRI